MAQKIDGKLIAENVRAELKEQVIEFMGHGNRAPKLVAILIGSDPASCVYVRNKFKVLHHILFTCYFNFHLFSIFFVIGCC